MAAAAVEVKNLENKGTFTPVRMPNDRSIQVLPLRWVFDYKFDQDGHLLKHKARICVRGDLERVTTEEKRAATLAARTARMLFALVAAFDLDLIQLDAVAAFLNSTLPNDVYTKVPDGFPNPGMCWKLVKALYGLRVSPKLWLQEATGVLQRLGFTNIPEDPCVFINNDGIIIFFYVDDILIASPKTKQNEAADIKLKLQRTWELTDHGDARWFLGIRIVRDRQLKKLWLCQDAYLASIAARYNLTNRPAVSTPLASTENFEVNEGQATSKQIEQYSSKLGSVQYATTITRVDAAKATSKLAQFSTNPGQQHLNAIDRLIVYLYHTRFQAIEYSVGTGYQSVTFASDASFADNVGRKSSSGYICQAYGGPVDWKASKQRTVTTSTTEAELLALSDAARSLQWWRRLLNRLHFVPDHPYIIQCDNKQTVDLVTSNNVRIHTKLRHIDIHASWLRQEVQQGRIRVDWVPTASMAADGLTKPLPRQKHAEFVRMLRMANIEAYIDE